MGWRANAGYFPTDVNFVWGREGGELMNRGKESAGIFPRQALQFHGSITVISRESGVITLLHLGPRHTTTSVGHLWHKSLNERRPRLNAQRMF